MKKVYDYYNKLSLGFLLISVIVVAILIYGIGE